MPTLPIVRVTLPAALVGQPNGRLPADLLVDTPGRDGGPVVRLVAPAARSWRALEAAAARAGHTLRVTSTVDSYRPYAVQESVFQQRYTLTFLSGRPTKQWLGRTWYLLPDMAPVAVPGTSNHGLAIAVDIANVAMVLNWLIANAARYGWSWELEVEPWHMRYVAGDSIPAAVIDFEESELTKDEMLALLKSPEGQAILGTAIFNRKISPASGDLAYLAWAETRDKTRALVAQVAALTEAVKALAGGQGADPEAIAAAAERGARAALAAVSVELVLNDGQE